jgi:hypothetical protein
MRYGCHMFEGPRVQRTYNVHWPLRDSRGRGHAEGIPQQREWIAIRARVVVFERPARSRLGSARHSCGRSVSPTSAVVASDRAVDGGDRTYRTAMTVAPIATAATAATRSQSRKAPTDYDGVSVVRVSRRDSPRAAVRTAAPCWLGRNSAAGTEVGGEQFDWRPIRLTDTAHKV